MNLLIKPALLVISASLAVGALVAACSSSSSSGGNADSGPPPCNQKPFECAAGSTCWIKDQMPTYACLTSGAGKKGDACMSLVDSATCGDGLGCFQQAQNTPGVCLAFCDPNDPSHGCGAGENCIAVGFNGNASLSAAIHICQPTSVPMDGGSDTGTPETGSDAPADTGTDTGTAAETGTDSGPPDAATD
jgi:hypothetical protein